MNDLTHVRPADLYFFSYFGGRVPCLMKGGYNIGVVHKNNLDSGIIGSLLVNKLTEWLYLYYTANRKSTMSAKKLNEIGTRIKEERVRLGLSQKKMAEIGNVTPKSQGIYEKNNRVPDAEYLCRLSVKEVDVQYVVTGVKSKSVLPIVDEVGDVVDIGEYAPEQYITAIMKVLAAVEGLDLKFTKRQVIILTDYALKNDSNHEELVAWIKTTFALAGVEIPEKS